MQKKTRENAIKQKHRIDISITLEAAIKEIGVPFNILTSKEDPENAYVFMFLIEFLLDGAYGLCIWHAARGEFIEEPGDFEDYGIEGLTDLYKKHPSLKIKK